MTDQNPDMALSPLHTRLLDAAGERTFRALSTLTGQNHETVRRYMQGAAPSVEFVAAFCDGLGLNANWLLTGRGPMKASDIRGDALSHANPTELLTATAGNMEQLDDRVDRLEVFVSTMESRIRASVVREAEVVVAERGEASATEKGEETNGRTRTAGEDRDRARRVADALPKRPRPDDR